VLTLDPLKKSFTQYINDGAVVCFFIIMYFHIFLLLTLSLSPSSLRFSALRHSADSCRRSFVWVCLCTWWSMENNTGGNVLRDIRTRCNPLTRFICSGDPQNRRNNVRASDNMTAPAVPPNRSFVSFKSRHRPADLIYANNCQKRWRKREMQRLGGRTMWKHYIIMYADEFDVVFINIVIWYYYYYCTTDKHSIRPGRGND